MSVGDGVKEGVEVGVKVKDGVGEEEGVSLGKFARRLSVLLLAARASCASSASKAITIEETSPISGIRDKLRGSIGVPTPVDFPT